MTTRTKVLIGIISIIILGLGMGTWLLLPKAPPAVQEAPEDDRIATTTAQATGSTPPKALPPEKPFVLPAGAVRIDDYAYSEAGVVYFKSLTGAAPLGIPNSNVETFRRLTDFRAYPGQSIVNDCGAAATYAFYGDNRQVYFYQFWRTPEFRSSTITVVKNADLKNFRVIDPLHITNGQSTLTVTYGIASSTCALALVSNK